MRNAWHVLPGAAAAALYAGAIGIVAGMLGCIIAGNLAFGARSGVAGFLLGGLALACAGWRSHRSRRAGFLDRWYHEDLSVAAPGDELTHIRFTGARFTGARRRAHAKGRR